MAITGFIRIELYENQNNLDTVALLELLQTHGWNFNYYKEISYLPLGDQENFNWTFAPLDQQDRIMDIIKHKNLNQELIGITLMWQTTDIGVTALFYPSLKSISLCLSTNRKTLDQMNVTDFSWYLERFVPPLLEAGLCIESLECSDG